MKCRDEAKLRALLTDLLLCGETFSDQEWQEACHIHAPGEEYPCSRFHSEVFIQDPPLVRILGVNRIAVTEAGKKFIQSQ